MDFKSAIITPTFNNEDYTVRCFESIAKNTRDYMIIWIDNGSKKESRKKVEDFLNENKIPHEKILNDENLGFVKATNQGMKKALELGAKYVVLQNNDTEVYRGWLSRMIKIAESDPKIGMVGPITSPCDSWQSISHVAKKFPEFSDLPNYEKNPEEYAERARTLYRDRVMDVSPTLAFFCTMIKKEVAEQIGFLSEEYGIGFSDDDDYCTRARRAGWKLMLAADVFVFHNHRTTFRANFTEDQIIEMKKKNLTAFSNKFHDEKDYNFERFLKTGKIDHFQGKKGLMRGRNKYLLFFTDAWYILRHEGLTSFIKKGIAHVKSQSSRRK